MRALPALFALLLAGCLVPAPAPGSSDGDVTFPGLLVETRLGTFTAILFERETPETVAFITRLVDAKYYDGRQFGRVIPGFVIQEVDRAGGVTDQPAKVRLEAPTNVMFSAGAFGIARDADPDSGSSEFFVMDHAVSPLYGNYTAFAQVVEGLDVVHAIARVPAVRTGPASAVGAPPGSPVSFGVHDRVPVDPVQMRVSRIDVTLPADQAARYPLVVGETVRADLPRTDPLGAEALRATLEWPRDLRAGTQSDLSWYLAPRDAPPQGQVRDPPPLDLRGATLRVTGASNATLAWEESPPGSGHLHFPFRPPMAGEYAFTLERDGRALVTSPPLVVAR